MRTYPSFFSQGGLEGVTWVCSYPVWKLYMHDLLLHPVLNSWDGEDDCFEFCLGGNFAMPWGGSERDLKSKQTLDNWRNCNSTLFNARPKTSWKSCQSSWRNWRSRPSTRQVGRLQIVNSKLTIGQKSLDNMNIVHNNVIVYATYFHLCQYWYSHYGFRFSRTEHMISFVSLVMVMTMMMLMLLLLMMMMIAHITWNTRWWPLAYTDAYWSEGYFGHILASWDE